MKLFFDEDTGTGVAKALIAVGVRGVEYVSIGLHRPIKKGASDEEWMIFVGEHGHLVLSCNASMLDAEAQRQMLIEQRIGIVFLPGRATAHQLLTLVLRRWDWLNRIDESEPRPFAFRLSLTGRARQIKL